MNSNKSVRNVRSKRVQRRRGKGRGKKGAANRKLATIGLVKKMIHANMENKFSGTAQAVQFNPFIDSVSDGYGLLPQIPLGTGDNARIGNRINPRGLLVSLSVYLSKDQNTPPGTVLLPRILVLRQKSTDGHQPITPDFTRLLDHGQGEHPFDGTLTAYKEPVNTDCFTVIKDIKTQLCMGSVEQQTQYIRHYKFWVPCPKTLNYADGQNTPQNFAPFICCGFAVGDGTVPTEAYTGVTMDWTTTLYYEDA